MHFIAVLLEFLKAISTIFSSIPFKGSPIILNVIGFAMKLGVEDNIMPG